MIKLILFALLLSPINVNASEWGICKFQQKVPIKGHSKLIQVFNYPTVVRVIKQTETHFHVITGKYMLLDNPRPKLIFIISRKECKLF